MGYVLFRTLHVYRYNIILANLRLTYGTMAESTYLLSLPWLQSGTTVSIHKKKNIQVHACRASFNISIGLSFPLS